MPSTMRRWARWLLAYDLLAAFVFVLFLQALLGDGVEVLWLSDRDGATSGLYLLLDDEDGDAVLAAARRAEVVSVTRYERPYMMFLGLLAIRLGGTWRLAPEEIRARYRSGWRRLGARLAFSALVALCLLAAIELALRIRHRRIDPTDSRLVVRNAEGASLRPGAEGNLLGRNVRINSMGFRGPELPPQRDGVDRRTRILFLGDSFTLGLGLDEEDTFVRRVEEGLRERGFTIDCVNAAVVGHRTTDEVRDLERHAPIVRPDIAVLVFFMDDAMPDREVGPTARKLYRDCVLFRRTYDAWLSLVDPWFDPAHVERCHADGAPIWEEQWAALQRFRDRSVARGVKPLVVLHPLLEALDEYPYEPARRFLVEKFRALGVASLDLTDAYLGRRERDLWLMPTDHHPNEEASRIASEAMTPWIAERLEELQKGGAQ